MKRRIAAVLLALCMCIGLLPATALAAGDGEYDFVRLMDRSDWKEATFLRAGEEETGTITLRRFFIYNEDDELLNSGAASGLATPDCYYADTKDVAPDEISRIVVCFTRTQGVKTTVVSAVFTKSDFVVSDTGGWGEAKHVELSLTDSGRQVPSGNAVRFYVELNDETTYTLYDTIYVQEGQQIGSQMPGNPPIGSYEFLGWGMPRLNKFSVSRSYFSWLSPKKHYRLDTNMNGGVRAYVVTGLYDKYLPMDIYPLYLLKAILAGDIDKMENLGIYEVIEEDFALCEFVDPSKTEMQAIIRQGIDLMIKELN